MSPSISSSRITPPSRIGMGSRLKMPRLRLMPAVKPSSGVQPFSVTEKGWTPLLGLTAGISLNLGIFNLLPIPILDGGVILLLLIEGLMRRDISLQIKERIYQAAFVFLVLFAVTVIYNDIVKRLPLGS